MKILLIDNYDSFTYNLKALLEECGAAVNVVRNDKVDFNLIEAYDGIVFSPGPGIPDEAGDLKRIIYQFAHRLPMLGVCLGMQAIAEVFGSELRCLDRPIHGFEAEIQHENDAIFEQLPQNFKAARYHSWVVVEDSLAEQLSLIAKTSSGEIMAIRHKDYPVFGCQFHPESVLTPMGSQIISNYLGLVKAFKNERITQKTI